MIGRNEYLERIINLREKPVIKVVTGVRRCGKSTLFELYKEYLLSTGLAENQIISLNLEDLENRDLLDYVTLHDYIKDRLVKDAYTYVFIDEVQTCKNFERAIDSLFIKKNIDVYITGSNANLLSGELATLLSGRYITIEMLPFSFAEYSVAKNLQQLEHRIGFDDYMQFGAFPYIATIEQDENSTWAYLEGVYSSILVKDIAKRQDITDISLLEDIVKTLCSSIGSPVSTKKISDTINSAGRKVSVNTVDNYLRFLTESFIFYKVNRYDIKGRNHLKTLGKYYLVDTGFRNLLLSTQSKDVGHQLENVVYLELCRRGYKVSIGKIDAYEVDFVAIRKDELLYVQVAASVLDETTLNRELFSLQKINDNHPKILLTLDVIGKNANYDGIRQYNVIDWLLGDI